MAVESCVSCGELVDVARGVCSSCGEAIGTMSASQLPTMMPGKQGVAAPERELPRRFGRYELLRIIGRGAQGTVYEADDSRLDCRVALKTLSTNVAGKSAQERMRDEARIAATFDHPNTVPVFDLGTIDGTLYFTMRLVEGLPLDVVLRIMHRTSSVSPPAWLEIPDSTAERTKLILTWFEGALEGLHYVHEKGVVHRDVKPSNLFLDANSDKVRIVDFGLAQAASRASTRRERGLLGTIAYMSPEQVRGDFEKIDRRSDVYSMGVSLYAALLDQLPYEAREANAYLREILRSAPSKSRGAKLPHDLATILHGSMEKAPAARYQTAKKLQEDLEHFRRREPIEFEPVGIAGRTLRWAQRKPGVAVLSSILIIAGIASSVLGAQVLRSNLKDRERHFDQLLVNATADFGEGRFRKARDTLTEAIGIDDSQVAPYIHRASASYRLLDFDAALEDLQRVDRLDDSLVSVHQLRAEIHERNGDPERAEQERQLVAGLTPSRAIDYQLLGDIARAESETENAIRYYDQAIEHDIGDLWSLLHRGLCYKDLGDLIQARIDFGVLAGRQPDHYFAYNNLGNVFKDGIVRDRRAGTPLDSSSRERMIAAYEKAIELAPEHPTIAYNYGTGLVQIGELERGEQFLRRAIELEPGFVEARWNLSDLLAEQERLDEAAIVIRSAVTWEEGRPEGAWTGMLADSLSSLCDVEVRRRDANRAAEACVRALDLNPTDKDNHYNFAMYSMLIGDRDVALDSLERNADLGDTDWNTLLGEKLFEPLHRHPRFESIVRQMKSAKVRTGYPTEQRRAPAQSK